MANIYVKSGAVGANNGTSWTDAYTTLVAALAVWTTADTIYVSNNHAEGASATLTIRKASPGAPVPIICVNDGAMPPTALATTGLINCTVGIVVDGDLYVYGLTFRNSTGGTSTALGVCLNASGKTYFENCRFEVAGGSSSVLQIGSNSATVVADPTLKNCTLKFSGTSQAFQMGFNRSTWIGCTMIDSGGIVPTNFCNCASNSGGFHRFFGCDFSAAAAGKTLFYNNSSVGTIHMVDCKLNASLGTLLAAPSNAECMRLVMTNTGAVNNNYTYKVTDNYAGTIDIDTTQYVTSGATAATDGTTSYSWKVQPTANAKFFQPFTTEWIAIWNDVTGVSQTITLELLVDAASAFNDNQVWIEGVYLANAGDQLAAEFSSRTGQGTAGGFLSAASALATGVGTAAWTKGAPVTGWISSKLTTTFTAQKKGVVYVRVCAATSTPFYINPHPAIA